MVWWLFSPTVGVSTADAGGATLSEPAAAGGGGDSRHSRTERSRGQGPRRHGCVLGVVERTPEVGEAAPRAVSRCQEPVARLGSLTLAGRAIGCLLHRRTRISQLMQRRLEASEHRGKGPGGAWISGKLTDGGSGLHEIATAVVELVVGRPRGRRRYDRGVHGREAGRRFARALCGTPCRCAGSSPHPARRRLRVRRTATPITNPSRDGRTRAAPTTSVTPRRAPALRSPPRKMAIRRTAYEAAGPWCARLPRTSGQSVRGANAPGHVGPSRARLRRLAATMRLLAEGGVVRPG